MFLRWTRTLGPAFFKGLPGYTILKETLLEMLEDKVPTALCLKSWAESTNFTQVYLIGLITNNGHAGFMCPVYYSWYWHSPQYDDLIKQPIVLGEMPVSAMVVSLLFLPSCYSTLPQSRLLLMLSVSLWPHKASIWVVSLSKISHIGCLHELGSQVLSNELQKALWMLHVTLQTFSPHFGRIWRSNERGAVAEFCNENRD